mgnify:CR=1 FL=1
MKSVFRTFLHGIVITAPLIITVYVCTMAVTWLDGTMRKGLTRIGLEPVPGLGLMVTVAGVYLVGLLARTWLFRQLVDPWSRACIQPRETWPNSWAAPTPKRRGCQSASSYSATRFT